MFGKFSQTPFLLPSVILQFFIHREWFSKLMFRGNGVFFISAKGSTSAKIFYKLKDTSHITSTTPVTNQHKASFRGKFGDNAGLAPIKPISKSLLDFAAVPICNRLTPMWTLRRCAVFAECDTTPLKARTATRPADWSSEVQKSKSSFLLSLRPFLQKFNNRARTRR